MNRYIRKLACYLIVGIISINVSFNSEARLPKYMAQHAAELLIEKSGLQFKDETPENRADKVIAYATKLVNFLYNTESRQSLANWMKRRLPFKVHSNRVNVSPDEMAFTGIFDDIAEDLVDNLAFRQFTNQRFPCWTGTMTCFMLSENSIANKALSEGKVMERCKESLSNAYAAYKVIGILFSLELADNWDDIKGICEKPEEPTPGLFAPYDPYDCVPVPNTAYIRDERISNKYQGSCMVSTIRNLLYILCRNDPNSKEIVTDNMNDSVKGLFSNPIYSISGTTSFSTLRDFANAILPGVTNEYRPDLALFAYTLYGLLKEKISINSLPTPKEYLNRIVPAELIKAILRKISDHDIEVEINNNPPKLTRTWPEGHLIISDTNVKKKITIAFGQCGTGTHMEIIDIKAL